eukprot:1142223-Pelagomonas_calceolata.AAC.1
MGDEAETYAVHAPNLIASQLLSRLIYLLLANPHFFYTKLLQILLRHQAPAAMSTSSCVLGAWCNDLKPNSWGDYHHFSV